MIMKKVVVIGGGFAGSLIAQKLEGNFEVILIDNKDYFEFTPWIFRAIVEPSWTKKIQVLHSDYLRKARIVVGGVTKVGKDFVEVNKERIYFDYLAICSGSKYESPFKQQGVVVASRANQLKDSYESLCKARDIVIVGGGLTGVELACEIIDFYKDKKITIVQSGQKLIERNSEKAIVYARNFLQKKGVAVRYGERAVSVKKGYCLGDKGTKIKADLVFVCTGFKPNYEFLDKRLLDEHNQLKVNAFLQVEGFRNVFAAGDITAIREEKTAQNAGLAAKVVVRNIIALENGRKLESYVGKKTPQVISLGAWDGIFDDGKVVLTGIIPAILKRIIRYKEMWKKLY